MNINLKNTDGAVSTLHRFRFNAFHDVSLHEPGIVNQSGKKGTQWIRLSGLPVGIACAVVAVACRLIAVAEPLFKGLANIFGAPFSMRCKGLRGVKQLAVDLPIAVAKLLLLLPLEVAGDLLVTPLAMLDSPRYAYARWSFESRMV